MIALFKICPENAESKMPFHKYTDKNENSALTKSEMRTLRKKQKKLKKMEHKESEKKLLNSNGD